MAGIMESMSREQWDRAKELLEDGNFEETVAALVKIPRTTWFFWKREAKLLRSKVENGEVPWSTLDDGQRSLLNFLEMLEMAHATAVSTHLKNIKTAGANPDRWQASAWYLERTDPRRFGKKDSHTVNGVVAHQNLDMTQEEMAEFAKNMSALVPGVFGEDDDAEPGEGQQQP